MDKYALIEFKKLEIILITKMLVIDGMNCNHCLMAVKEELEAIGISDPKVEIGSATITYDENSVSDDALYEAIDEAGFTLKEIKNKQ